MTGSILDILIYVFDRYMLADAPEVPEREHLARDLERAGFTPANVERALDWLTDLAFGHDRPPLPEATSGTTAGGVRVFSDSEHAAGGGARGGLRQRRRRARVLRQRAGAALD